MIVSGEKERLYLLDVTLTEGGRSCSGDAERSLVEALNKLGVDYVATEGLSRPLPERFVSQNYDCGFQLTSFGLGRDDVSGRSLKEGVAAVRRCVAGALRAGGDVIVVLRRFFEGMDADSSYALAIAEEAYQAGARWVVLSDCAGKMAPLRVDDMIQKVVQVVPGDHLGFLGWGHSGHAVGNGLLAVKAGVRLLVGALPVEGQVDGAAALHVLVPTLLLTDEFVDRFEMGVTAAGLPFLGRAQRLWEDAGWFVSTISSQRSAAPVKKLGRDGGVSASFSLVMSDVVRLLEKVGLAEAFDEQQVLMLFEDLRARLGQGYVYDEADASFFLLAHQLLPNAPAVFVVDRFQLTTEQRGALVGVSQADVQMVVDGETMSCTGEGDDPVVAVERALRRCLQRYQKVLDGVALVDYHVRLLTGWRGPQVRVIVACKDRSGRVWRTVGVAEQIIDALLEALLEAFAYRLLLDCSLSLPSQETVDL